ncbi:MAG: Holliday junction resolvase RuvX [Gammaproteobacteria bacterium]|nr:MAG: Holliday junction resolvase RuvX [Gammaproteobacteria bacterium]RKZ73974.1 MAG: Holliday junction resolvase RuvX [Gammaproteobacteria bacterium]
MSINVNKSVMGFDYGTKRIGIAVGQTLTRTARPLAIVLVKNRQPDWKLISTLIQEWQPDTLIVGLPKYADGSDNAITDIVRRFSRQLQGRYQLSVQTIDETLSSVAAAEKISTCPSFSKGKIKPYKTSKGRKALDAIAAQIILETWFTT